MTGKIGLGIVGAAVVGALVLGPALLSDAPTVTPTASVVATVDRSTWRQAVADWPCLQAAGIDADKLREVCLWGRRLYVPSKSIDVIVCLTDRQQVHACEIEVPAALLQRWGVCRYQEAGEWVLFKGWVDMDWVKPVGWTCNVVLPGGWWKQSISGVLDPLTVALREKCGWGEEIQPDSWGNCPDCLMWPDGCGPCRLIADKYGRGWVGHEAECNP
uniref:Uncharacterized protein n=1 Tax=viral metagenome TaxID=1070528 RepID=A0A6H1ZG71_9ZZZZ